MYTDIEKKLNKITDDLETLLIESKAIDKNGSATDVKKFNEIIDEKIAQCNKVLATTEKDGVTKDLYGANITYARINRLEKMKKAGTITPETGWADEENGVTKHSSAKTKKKEAFGFGISKLFAKIKNTFRASNSSENNR